TFAISFRWTSLTGGEGGLGGIERGGPAWLNLDGHLNYYLMVALIAFGLLCVMLRIVRSPFGHVLVAIRENQQRATFQGYNVDRYKLMAFVISATISGLSGALMVFLHRLAAAESTTVAFSGELLAMVVIGGMHSFLGPALGALFFLLFRELFSIWTSNWLLYFGLIFVGFIIFFAFGSDRDLGSDHEAYATAAGRRCSDEQTQNICRPGLARFPPAQGKPGSGT
ncbi:MAG: branched-chain amino acid ABC transporter permease, partial [Hylemonella sp.]